MCHAKIEPPPKKKKKKQLRMCMPGMVYTQKSRRHVVPTNLLLAADWFAFLLTVMLGFKQPFSLQIRGEDGYHLQCICKHFIG